MSVEHHRWRCPPISRKSVLLPPLILLTIGFFLLNYNIRLNVVDMKPQEAPALQCTPHHNVVFMKTHKCASSTIQNVLMRFGDAHNFTFVLFPSGNYLGHPHPFERHMVPNLTAFNRSYNMLVHHSLLNKPEMAALIPDDPIFLTIVRDPVDLFESLYSYYALGGFYRMTLAKFSTLPKDSRILHFRSLRRFGPNQMSFDLGLDRDQFSNVTAVEEYIRYLDEEVFDLVMISEQMDESLVLLRHLLCWELQDVVAFRVNARSDKFKRRLPETVRSRLRVVNAADQLLYDYFLSRFEERIERFGRERMSREVAELRSLAREWYDACVHRQDMLRRIPGAYQKIASPQVLAFRPKNNSNATCWRLTAPELEFTDRLRQKQAFMFPELRRRPPKMVSLKTLKKRRKKATSKRKKRS